MHYGACLIREYPAIRITPEGNHEMIAVIKPKRRHDLEAVVSLRL
jgi:hypothetical protein